MAERREIAAPARHRALPFGGGPPPFFRRLREKSGSRPELNTYGEKAVEGGGVMYLAQEVVGYVASGLVLLTFATKQMRLLRIIAILSNVAFIGYGALDGIVPVLGLHMILLPLNVFRLAQIEAAARRESSAQRSAVTELCTPGLRIEGDDVTAHSIEPIGHRRWIVTLTAQGRHHPLHLMVEIAPGLPEAAAGVASPEPLIAAVAAADG